jgi:plasmid stabilization system protein ParE
MKIVITEAAKNDLIEIGEFIRPHHPKRAASFIAELLDCCNALGDMPYAFPLVPRYERHGIRRYAYRDYLIFTASVMIF